MATERREQCRAQRAAGDDRARRRWISTGAQHRHAGHELTGQRHHHQRQGDVQDRAQAELRRDPHRRGQADHQRFTMQITGERGNRTAHQQHHHHCITRHHTLADQVAGKHRQDQQRLVLHRHEQPGAETEQDPRQHRRRDGGGQLVDDPVESARDANHENDQAADQISPHRLCHGDVRQQRHQQRRARRRPGDDHRNAVAQAQTDTEHGAANGDRPDPGRQHFPRKMCRFCRLKDDHQRAGIGNHRGNQSSHGG
ncbi:hypothetical protein D3C87_1195630 [compost metagenome]